MFGKLTAVSVIRNNKAKDVALPKEPGVYKWWCTKNTLDGFLEQLKNIDSTIELDYQFVESQQDGETTYYCFYVGMTKAKIGLAGRVKGLHIGAKTKKTNGRAIKGSTLRKSINALKNGSNAFCERYVDDILDACFVEWEVLKEEEIDKVEVGQINLGNYIRIFNIKDVDQVHPMRKKIVEALEKARKQ